MHDCRVNGGHFFVHKPQNYAFRCRRCSERFTSSCTASNLKHPWKCLIERCEYIACDPCSDILMEELAGEDAVMGGVNSLVERKEDVDRKQGLRRGTMEGQRMEMDDEKIVIEADDEECDEPYEIPIFTRTARQAAAQAAMKRAHVKVRPRRQEVREEH